MPIWREASYYSIKSHIL